MVVNIDNATNRIIYNRILRECRKLLMQTVFEFNDDCFDPCNCPPIEAPVCVQTSSGLLQFQNECIANCAGFSSADFVNCN